MQRGFGAIPRDGPGFPVVFPVSRPGRHPLPDCKPTDDNSALSHVLTYEMLQNARGDPEPLAILGKMVSPGTKERLELFVSALSTGTPLTVPVIVAHGRLAGPTLLLSAAIHGDEINGVEICRRVLGRIDPFALHGTVIAVPVVNVFGFITQSRYLPDRRDLNRSFPGSPKGSLASRLAHLFLDRVVSLCDIGIDFHTGSGGRRNLPQIRANLKDDTTRQLAEVFAAPVCVQARERAKSLRSVAAESGKTMLLFEGGEVLRFEEDVISIGVAGTLRVMKHLGMLPMIATEPCGSCLLARDGGWLRSTRGGILHLNVALGQTVERHEVLGSITDMFGNVRGKVVAQDAGMIIGHVTNPLVSRGDALVHLACPQ